MTIITTGELPGVTFHSLNAFRANANDAIAIEAIRTAFQATGDEGIFWEEMTASGFDYSEIETAVANPVARPLHAYV